MLWLLIWLNRQCFFFYFKCKDITGYWVIGSGWGGWVGGWLVGWLVGYGGWWGRGVKNDS